MLCRLVDVKIGFSFYYDNSTTDNIAPIDIWLVFSENKIHAFFFNTKYNRITIISAITRRFFPSIFPRFQLVSSFYRAYTLIVSCFSRACWMQSIKLFPALTVLRSNAFQTVTIFYHATVINYMFTPACHCPNKRFFNLFYRNLRQLGYVLVPFSLFARLSYHTTSYKRLF